MAEHADSGDSAGPDDDFIETQHLEDGVVSESEKRENGEGESQSEAFEKYQTFAETVGGVPSVRPKDNLYQGVAVLLATAIGAAAGFVYGGGTWAVLLGLAGMVIGLLGSGIVLMILGWVRATRRLG